MSAVGRDDEFLFPARGATARRRNARARGFAHRDRSRRYCTRVYVSARIRPPTRESSRSTTRHSRRLPSWLPCWLEKYNSLVRSLSTVLSLVDDLINRHRRRDINYFPMISSRRTSSERDYAASGGEGDRDGRLLNITIDGARARALGFYFKAERATDKWVSLSLRYLSIGKLETLVIVGESWRRSAVVNNVIVPINLERA